LLRIYNFKNKNKKLAKRWDQLYVILKILGQSTAEIKKWESRERAKIVHFTNLKLYHFPSPTTIEQPKKIDRKHQNEKGHVINRYINRSNNSSVIPNLKQQPRNIK
jgi:hypothetical protein